MERGTHLELLARGGMYASMWGQQQRSLQQRGREKGEEEEEERGESKL